MRNGRQTSQVRTLIRLRSRFEKSPYKHQTKLGRVRPFARISFMGYQPTNNKNSPSFGLKLIKKETGASLRIIVHYFLLIAPPQLPQLCAVELQVELPSAVSSTPQELIEDLPHLVLPVQSEKGPFFCLYLERKPKLIMISKQLWSHGTLH